MNRIYLDDVRDPKSENWTVVRDFNSFVDAVMRLVELGEKLDAVSFDHDLGENSWSGYDAAKRLCQIDMDTPVLDEDFIYNVHSANPPGKANIEAYMKNYLKFKQTSV